MSNIPPYLPRLEFLFVWLALFSIGLAEGANVTDSAPVPEAPPNPTIFINISADFLAFHAEVKSPEGTITVQYRFGETDINGRSVWTDFPGPMGADRTVRVDIPLPNSRWNVFQVRAMKGAEVLATSTKRNKPRAFTLVTPEKIASLPEPQRDAWLTYLAKSARFAAAEYDVIAAECRAANVPKSKPAPHGGRFQFPRDTQAPWFKANEAGQLADTIISFQTPTGGWSKAVSYEEGPRQPGTHWSANPGNPWHYCGTLDNLTTTSQIRFLAAVHTATGRKDAKTAAVRGFEWLLTAQFPNGGWPQNYPLEPGYHEAITLNDGAMGLAMKLLLEASRGESPFAFIDTSLRQRLRHAFDQGINCLAAAQVIFDGKPSVWCAQHDPITLQPTQARRMEPAALSGSESAELLKFLMREGPLTDQIVAMVEPAVTWLDRHRMTGLKRITNNGKIDFIADPQSTEVYWARFYHPVTAKPIFAGYEDGILYESYSEMAAKNDVAYDYFSTRPGDIIEKELPRWKERMAKEGFTPSRYKQGTGQPSR